MIRRIETFEDDPEMPFACAVDLCDDVTGKSPAKVLITMDGFYSCACREFTKRRTISGNLNCKHVEEVRSYFAKSRDLILMMEKTKTYVSQRYDGKWTVRKWSGGFVTCSCYGFAAHGGCSHIKRFTRDKMEKVAQAKQFEPIKISVPIEEKINQRNWNEAFGNIPMPDQPAFKPIKNIQPNPKPEPPAAVNATGRVKRKFKL